MVLVVTLLLSACSQFKDALVINPCDHKIEVRLSDSLKPPSNVEQWLLVGTIEPISVKRQANAFSDVGNHEDLGIAEVESEGEKRIVRVPYSPEDPVPVVIPASVCSSK